MTRKTVDKLVGQRVVFVTVYGDQFSAIVKANDGQWCFRTEDYSGRFDRSDIVEYHPL